MSGAGAADDEKITTDPGGWEQKEALGFWGDSEEGNSVVSLSGLHDGLRQSGSAASGVEETRGWLKRFLPRETLCRVRFSAYGPSWQFRGLSRAL
jgi:hypothetical protein